MKRTKIGLERACKAKIRAYLNNVGVAIEDVVGGALNDLSAGRNSKGSAAGSHLGKVGELRREVEGKRKSDDAEDREGCENWADLKRSDHAQKRRKTRASI